MRSERKTLSNSFYEASITWIPKQDKDNVRKIENDINKIAEILNKILEVISQLS